MATAAAAGQSTGKQPDLRAPRGLGDSFFALEGGKGDELLLAASQGFLQGRGIYLFPKQSSSVAAAGKCSSLSFPFSCCSLSSLKQGGFTEATETFCSDTEARTLQGLFLQG